MSNPAVAAHTMPASIDALDAALADFNLDDSVEQEVVIEENHDDDVIEEVAAPSVLADDELADLDLAISRNEIYEEQEAGASIDSTEPPVPTPAKAPKGSKKPRAASAGTATARVPRDISTVADEFFVLTGDPKTMSDEDKAAARAATMALKPIQVKIAEKFENLFTALSVGKEPSTYVMTAFELLEAKGSMSSSDVVGAYKASGLGEGTARSQSGQIMHLFATVGIADRAGQTLTLRKDSVIAERLRGVSVPAAAA